MDNQPIIHLKNNLSTDYAGIKALFSFYDEASQYYNTTIYIDFYHLTWFDANLSALFGSLLHRLSIENNLQFSTDMNYVKERFNVLFRNGFMFSDVKMIDEQQSTISYMSFSPTDKEGFVSYIENDLLCHRGMPKLEQNKKDNIIDSLIEVYCNIQTHSKSNKPFFVCGQYYPAKGFIVFSMVDSGVGFLPAIYERTNGKIVNSYEAINWALEKGNTTRENGIGGIGLFDLYDYFKKNNGNFQIITGDTFWSIDLESTQIKSYQFDNEYKGSILNLFFKCN